jgi:hypothetical protein
LSGIGRASARYAGGDFVLMIVEFKENAGANRAGCEKILKRLKADCLFLYKVAPHVWSGSS